MHSQPGSRSKRCFAAFFRGGSGGRLEGRRVPQVGPGGAAGGPGQHATECWDRAKHGAVVGSRPRGETPSLIAPIMSYAPFAPASWGALK
eukprot:scaffold192621_cov38-Prasinocladus_malaysianus.AAC.1